MRCYNAGDEKLIESRFVKCEFRRVFRMFRNVVYDFSSLRSDVKMSDFYRIRIVFNIIVIFLRKIFCQWYFFFMY